MYYKCSHKFSSHLPITVSISCSSCSSTSGCCLSSSSMKKRLMDRVSGAAITISSTHCLTFSADSSPWFWKRTHVDVWVRGSAEYLHKKKKKKKEMAFIQFSNRPVRIWALQWSWCCPVYQPAPYLSSSARQGSLWHPAAPGCEITHCNWLSNTIQPKHFHTREEDVWNDSRCSLVPLVNPAELEVNVWFDQHSLPSVKILLDLQQQLFLWTQSR